MRELNYYEILEISDTASTEEIRKAYKKLALKWHPDLNPPKMKEQSDREFKKVNNAYETLKDKSKKGAYDRKLNIESNNNWFALLYAASKGYIEIVRDLIEAGVDMDKKSIDGITALILTIEKEHFEITRLLIDSNANPNVANEDGATPLFFAASKDNCQIAKLLIRAGANMETRAIVRLSDGTDFCTMNVLMLATHVASASVVKLLINEGVDVHASVKGQGTSLFCLGNIPDKDAEYLEIIRMLVRAGIDIEARSENGNTALTFASQKGHTEIAKGLIEEGADKNARTTVSRSSSLIFAIQEGHIETARALIEKGVDLGIANNKGDTALTIARKKGYTEIVKELIKAGVDRSVKTDIGDDRLTRLMPSAFKGYTENVCHGR